LMSWVSTMRSRAFLKLIMCRSNPENYKHPYPTGGFPFYIPHAGRPLRFSTEPNIKQAYYHRCFCAWERAANWTRIRCKSYLFFFRQGMDIQDRVSRFILGENAAPRQTCLSNPGGSRQDRVAGKAQHEDSKKAGLNRGSVQPSETMKRNVNGWRSWLHFYSKSQILQLGQNSILSVTGMYFSLLWYVVSIKEGSSAVKR